MENSVNMEQGFGSRQDYLQQICEEYPAEVVDTLTDLIANDDFVGVHKVLTSYDHDMEMSS